MVQLVAEEMGFGQGWDSPSHTVLTKRFPLLFLNYIFLGIGNEK